MSNPEQESMIPENLCSGLSEPGTMLLRVVCRRANREGRCWINRAAVYDATGAQPDRAASIVQELIDHQDVILETERDGGWVLTVLREVGPG